MAIDCSNPPTNHNHPLKPSEIRSINRSIDQSIKRERREGITHLADVFKRVPFWILMLAGCNRESAMMID